MNPEVHTIYDNLIFFFSKNWSTNFFTHLQKKMNFVEQIMDTHHAILYRKKQSERLQKVFVSDLI